LKVLNIVIATYVDDDPLAKVMIVRYGLEVCDACVLGVGIRPILVLAAEFRQRSAIIKIATSLITCRQRVRWMITPLRSVSPIQNNIQSAYRTERETLMDDRLN